MIFSLAFTTPVLTVFAEPKKEIDVDLTANNIKKHENISDFLKPAMKIDFKKTISDFNGNGFLFYELSPSAYANYSQKDDSSKDLMMIILFIMNT